MKKVLLAVLAFFMLAGLISMQPNVKDHVPEILREERFPNL